MKGDQAVLCALAENCWRPVSLMRLMSAASIRPESVDVPSWHIRMPSGLYHWSARKRLVNISEVCWTVCFYEPGIQRASENERPTELKLFNGLSFWRVLFEVLFHWLRWLKFLSFGVFSLLNAEAPIADWSSRNSPSTLCTFGGQYAASSTDFADGPYWCTCRSSRLSSSEWYSADFGRIENAPFKATGHKSSAIVEDSLGCQWDEFNANRKCHLKWWPSCWRPADPKDRERNLNAKYEFFFRSTSNLEQLMCFLCHSVDVKAIVMKETAYS